MSGGKTGGKGKGRRGRKKRLTGYISSNTKKYLVL
jgi:hypothetical protein